jgi:hypothetical protein
MMTGEEIELRGYSPEPEVLLTTCGITAAFSPAK